ncbi:NAD(P)-binding protein [Lentithecium fluviatile CBS 122367]|uniref:NAD(P)-binding protein n=1 Tax=Lentithecium fluviatile CBS 122367 TaxID=1168545 RepID=A0A6G1J144_9PLEO|nr:NAD(P)-binding protein [Lentithecium fluviatile CBS 122367]
MASFENKVVIITGCSSGIGLATTRLFLDRQAKVFGIDISRFKEELTEAQQKAFVFHEVDLTIPKAADDAVAACVIKYGPKIDVLINCAGISDGWSSADTLKDSEWERVIMVNLTVPVRLMTAVLPSMKEHKGGAIVNVGSKAGVSGASSGIAYTASKHGLVGATKNVAWRFHSANIRCNAVLPGGVNTNISSSVNMECFDPVGFGTFFPVVQLHVGKDEKGQPVTIIEPNDVARGIAFLASDEAKMVNGALLPIDAAWSTI